MHSTAKRFIGLAATALMAAVVIVPVSASQSSAATVGFRDVPGNHQFYTAITWMNEAGITTGYTFDDTFRPREQVSREAFAAYLYRLEGRPNVSLPSSSPFKDVKKGDQFYKEIVWLSQQNITNGWTDGTFRPKWNINRDAMAAFLYRYEGRPNYSPPSSSPFKDVKNSAQFYKEINWMASEGISTGWTDDNTFRPYSGSSREATAAFLFRAHGPSNYNPGSYQAPPVNYDASKVLSVARSQVGYREPGWQRNKYNDWIGTSSVWCQVYVGWVFNEAGYYGLVPEEGYWGNYVKKIRDAGVLDWNPSKSDLKPGHVVLLDWNRGNNVTHTGIVHKVDGNGVWLYEGNTSDGTGNNGRGVFHRWRTMGYISAVFDPQDYYEATT